MDNYLNNLNLMNENKELQDYLDIMKYIYGQVFQI
jgi:hypothetical protein